MPVRGASSQKNVLHGVGLGDDRRFDDLQEKVDCVAEERLA